MKILIADDDDLTRLTLASMLTRQGHEVVAVRDGTEALEILQGPGAPRLAVLDWMMEKMDGVEVCRRLRDPARPVPVYLILLTSRGSKQHIVEGLRAGANDYVTKPFDPQELEARINVGKEMTRLQTELAGRVRELEMALARVQQLQGLLPICAYCKSIRDDKNYWHNVEVYLQEHSQAMFSHGVCPRCWKEVVRPEYQKQGISLPEQCPH